MGNYIVNTGFLIIVTKFKFLNSNPGTCAPPGRFGWAAMQMLSCRMGNLEPLREISG